MQLKKIASKIFCKILTWLYRVRLTSSVHSHDSLCKQDEITVLNDALTQLVRRTWKFRLKGTNYPRGFSKTTSRFKFIFAVSRQKHLQPIMGNDCNHVIHGNSQGNSHSRKRKIYSIKTMITRENVLQLIIKGKLYKCFQYICFYIQYCYCRFVCLFVCLFSTLT
jgi:hypothetical protein